MFYDIDFHRYYQGPVKKFEVDFDLLNRQIPFPDASKDMPTSQNLINMRKFLRDYNFKHDFVTVKYEIEDDIPFVQAQVKDFETFLTERIQDIKKIKQMNDHSNSGNRTLNENTHQSYLRDYIIIMSLFHKLDKIDVVTAMSYLRVNLEDLSSYFRFWKTEPGMKKDYIKFMESMILWYFYEYDLKKERKFFENCVVPLTLYLLRGNYDRRGIPYREKYSNIIPRLWREGDRMENGRKFKREYVYCNNRIAKKNEFNAFAKNYILRMEKLNFLKISNGVIYLTNLGQCIAQRRFSLEINHTYGLKFQGEFQAPNLCCLCIQKENEKKEIIESFCKNSSDIIYKRINYLGNNIILPNFLLEEKEMLLPLGVYIIRKNATEAHCKELVYSFAKMKAIFDPLFSYRSCDFSFFVYCDSIDFDMRKKYPNVAELINYERLSVDCVNKNYVFDNYKILNKEIKKNREECLLVEFLEILKTLKEDNNLPMKYPLTSQQFLWMLSKSDTYWGDFFLDEVDKNTEGEFFHFAFKSKENFQNIERKNKNNEDDDDDDDENVMYNERRRKFLPIDNEDNTTDFLSMVSSTEQGIFPNNVRSLFEEKNISI